VYTLNKDSVRTAL